MTKYFVFRKGLRGPEPQILHDSIPTDGGGKSKEEYLFIHKLEDKELNSSLDDLAEKFKSSIAHE